MKLHEIYVLGRQYRLTISRMSGLQVRQRLRNIVLRQWWRIRPNYRPRPPMVNLPALNLPRFGRTPPLPAGHPVLQKANAVCRGRFTFLNQTIDFTGIGPDWSTTPDGDRLWGYNLHYFEYGRDLLWAYRSTGQDVYLRCLIHLIQHWVDHNPLWTAVAWEPYTVSKRLISWSTLLGHLHDDPIFRQECLPVLLPSLAQQTEFLAHNVEYDVDNNHLITNARALITAAVHLPHQAQAAQWFQEGMSLLQAQIARQILPDSGHCERSSSYHLVVLQDFLETLLLLEQAGIPQPLSLRTTVERMADFVLSVIGPDGRMPLVNDTIENYPQTVGNLLAACAILLQRPDLKSAVVEAPDEYIEWLFEPTKVKAYQLLPTLPALRSSVALPDTGYFVMRSGEDRNAQMLLFDCGPVGPAHSAAHAHADTLSFTLSALGQQLLVDPGVYEYKRGPWRDYFRSTAVHNSVTVDQQDQSVFWGPFRVAEMARVRCLRWETGETYDYVEGEHDGYARLRSPVIHHRSIRYAKPDRWTITDRLTSDGRANHLYQLHFHLAPSAQPEHITVSSSRITFPNGIALFIETEHPSTTSVELCDAWTSYTWKQKQASKILRYSLQTSAVLARFKTTLTICELASIS
jgi:uncharacterized heparinase superfamily protein